MILCTLKRHIRKYYTSDLDDSHRYGLYLHSLFHSIKGYGKKCWGVGVEIDLDYYTAAQKYSDEEIVKKCIEYLNTPQKSKYGKRRRRKLSYGAFEPEPYRFWIKEKNGQSYIQAILLANKKKNNKFWGEGPQL
jgi:hypothetical protein